MAMGSSLSSVVSNVYMVHSVKLVSDTEALKPTTWLRHVHDTSVVWSHGPARLQ